MFNKTIFFLVVTSSILLAASCAEKDYLIIFKTEYGDMEAILYEETPLHKENFIKLAKEGQYDSTIFHRVIENFMIQGGDVSLKDRNVEPDKYTIPAEFVPEFFHHKGAIAGARQGDQVNPEKASSWCQFYIVHGSKYTESALRTDMNMLNMGLRQLLQNADHADLLEEFNRLYKTQDRTAYDSLIMASKPLVEKELGVKLDKEISAERVEKYSTIGGAPHLDDEYTVFGRIVNGLEVIDKIAGADTKPGDRPINDIRLAIELKEMKKKDITEKYGYQYPEKE